MAGEIKVNKKKEKIPPRNSNMICPACKRHIHYCECKDKR